MKITIIGVDCATVPNKVGLALGQSAGGEGRIDRVMRGSRTPSVAETIAGWAASSDCVLLALDAPLGWPTDLGASLADHMAGEVIRVPRKKLFRRETDRFVKRKLGKQPFAVGADKIAHTAHDALDLLQQVRELTGQPIPLAWDREIDAGIHAIEVYPGATLEAYRIEAKGYKDKKAVRRKVLAFLGKQVRLPEDTQLMEDNADALDAGLCVLAAVDFLLGRAMRPEDQQKARQEGWIWVREPVK
jgi:predicted RNase H-like nuclease